MVATDLAFNYHFVYSGDCWPRPAQRLPAWPSPLALRASSSEADAKSLACARSPRPASGAWGWAAHIMLHYIVSTVWYTNYIISDHSRSYHIISYHYHYIILLSLYHIIPYYMYVISYHIISYHIALPWWAPAEPTAYWDAAQNQSGVCPCICPFKHVYVCMYVCR